MQLRGIQAFNALIVFIASASAANMAAIPPAFNPLLTVTSLTPQQPVSPVTNGFFQLTPDGYTGNNSSNGMSTSGTCSGFIISNDPLLSANINSAMFTPASDAVIVDPMQSKTYEIGTVTLTNNGFKQPMGAGMTVIPVKSYVTVEVPNLNQPTTATLDFQVMWSLGSPAPPNTAGIFALVTANPAPSYPFQVAMSNQRTFNMNLNLLGFTAGTTRGSGAVILGDWGQQNPPSGQPGPRVYVEEGSAQVVKLYAMISNTDNPRG